MKTENIYHQALEQILFGVNDRNLYVFQKLYWQKVTDVNAAQLICNVLPQDIHGSISDGMIKEAVKRIKNTPKLQIHFANDENENLINVVNGVFDVNKGGLMMDTNLNFPYLMDFTYLEDAKLEDAPVFGKFVADIFPEATIKKTQLLLEMFGYCLSEYTKAKGAMFFIGVSNSGKTTLLNLLARVFPNEAVSAVPLSRLGNRFNLAKLASSKINICTELAENSFNALDVFKQLTSGDIVTAETKGGAPFEFKTRSKIISAGNVFPELKALEGMDAIINRMVLLLFDVSIEKEKQNLFLEDQLYGERDVIFSLALKALVELYNRNFVFTVPTDTKCYKEQLLSKEHAFELFLEERCEFIKGGQVHFVKLYEAFREYCDDNLLDVKLTKTQFTQQICTLKTLEKKKFRMPGTKPLWGVTGLKLANAEVLDKKKSEDESNHGGKAEDE